METVAWVLVVISTWYGGNGFLQESRVTTEIYENKEACEVSRKVIEDNATRTKAFCLPKGLRNIMKGVEVYK